MTEFEGAEGVPQQHARLVQQLTLNMVRSDYEAQGIPVSRTGLFRAYQISRQFLEFEEMSEQELQAAYVGRALPRRADMGREQVLAVLRSLLIWEALPLQELQADCRGQGLMTEFEGAEGVPQQHAMLVQQLTLNMFRSDYEAQGIRVSQTGLLRAYQISRQFLEFEEMSEQELQAACRRCRIPAVPNMSSRDMEKRLQERTLWSVLPAADLWVESQRRGIEEELREVVLAHLLERAHDAPKRGKK